MTSNPTSRALVVDSYDHFINLKIQKKVDRLEKSSQYRTNLTSDRTMNELITSICKYQKPFVEKSLFSIRKFN